MLYRFAETGGTIPINRDQVDRRKDMTFDEYAAGSAHSEPVSPDVPSASMRPGSGLMARRGLVTAAAVALTALTAIAGVIGVRAASADVSRPVVGQPEPTATSFDAAFWHRQDLLIDLRGWIESLPGIKTSGYVTNINNEPVDGSTILVWHGPPDRVQRQIMNEARRRHIPISIQQRRHTMNDLEQAANQLSDIDSGTGVFQNFKVSAVGSFDIDFDGVTVLGDYIHPPAEGVAAADTALVQALAAKTGVIVRIEHGQIVW
jgi:hypothetical protein